VPGGGGGCTGCLPSATCPCPAASSCPRSASPSTPAPPSPADCSCPANQPQQRPPNPSTPRHKTSTVGRMSCVDCSAGRTGPTYRNLVTRYGGVVHGCSACAGVGDAATEPAAGVAGAAGRVDTAGHSPPPHGGV